MEIIFLRLTILNAAYLYTKSDGPDGVKRIPSSEITHIHKVTRLFKLG
jgi:hypothetical protein